MFWGASGIMSCRFAALLHLTMHPSPLQPLVLSSASPFHFAPFAVSSSSLCHLCCCQSRESLSGRIIGTHICSRRNLASVLSDGNLEKRLIIIVGGGDQRKARAAARERASVLNPNFERADPPLARLSAPHCTIVAKSCPCRPWPVWVWKGLAYSMMAPFLFSPFRKVLALHRKRIHRGPGIHIVMVVIAMGKNTLWLLSPLKS